MFVVAFPSLLDPTEKERGTMNSGWCVESAASATAHPDERVEMVALEEEMEIAVCRELSITCRRERTLAKQHPHRSDLYLTETLRCLNQREKLMNRS